MLMLVWTLILASCEPSPYEKMKEFLIETPHEEVIATSMPDDTDENTWVIYTSKNEEGEVVLLRWELLKNESFDITPDGCSFYCSRSGETILFVQENEDFITCLRYHPDNKALEVVCNIPQIFLRDHLLIEEGYSGVSATGLMCEMFDDLFGLLELRVNVNDYDIVGNICVHDYVYEKDYDGRKFLVDDDYVMDEYRENFFAYLYEFVYDAVDLAKEYDKNYLIFNNTYKDQYLLVQGEVYDLGVDRELVDISWSGELVYDYCYYISLGQGFDCMRFNVKDEQTLAKVVKGEYALIYAKYSGGGVFTDSQVVNADSHELLNRYAEQYSEYLNSLLSAK